MKVTIKHDIEVDGAVAYKAGTELSVRRPKAKDMVVIGDHLPALAALDRDNPEQALSGAVFAAMIAVVGTLADIGEDAAREMDFEDMVAVSTEAMSALGEAQRGGEEASGAAPSQTPRSS